MNKLLSALLVSCLLPACVEALPDSGVSEEELAASENNVVEGIAEPDWKHPWQVSVGGGCRGVLIDPSYVLTAAHCVSYSGVNVSYKRTDANGNVYSDDRDSASGGIFVNPDWNPSSGSFKGDLALVRLASPFTITPQLQTVGLPKGPRQLNTIGTIAAFTHTGDAGPGEFAVLRAPITDVSWPPAFEIRSDSASLCPGDSGSGFVTVEGSRATVRGIASNATVQDCTQVGKPAGMTDVYYYKSWILEKMGKSEAAVAGNTRVRWSGKSAKGVMGIGCTNPAGTMYGPLNVLGAAEGANCAANESQTVLCVLQGTQSLPVEILGFTMKTTFANGQTSTVSLPHSATSAFYYGMFPAGVTREFSCMIGNPIVWNPGGGVLTGSVLTAP